MVKFIDRIIWCSILTKISDLVINEAPSTLLKENDYEFILKSEKDSNVIAAKTQLYFSFHKAACIKYEAAILT